VGVAVGFAVGVAVDMAVGVGVGLPGLGSGFLPLVTMGTTNVTMANTTKPRRLKFWSRRRRSSAVRARLSASEPFGPFGGCVWLKVTASLPFETAASSETERD
jgi:hypothetical protein